MKSKKILTKILSIALACVMLVMCMGAYEGEVNMVECSDPVFVRNVSSLVAPYRVDNTTVKVKVIQDISFQNEFSGTIDSTLDNASKAFRNRWNYLFDYGVFNVIDKTKESHDCPNGYDQYCNTASCGSNCENKDSIWKNHHKNFYSIHQDVKQKGWIDNFNLQVFVTMDATCVTNNSEHLHGPYAGLADRNGEHSTVISSFGDINNVRILQHEISHNFGCLDKNPSECVDENGKKEKCIMSGGYDWDSNYYYSSIWCYACEQDFNNNKF